MRAHLFGLLFFAAILSSNVSASMLTPPYEQIAVLHDSLETLVNEIRSLESEQRLLEFRIEQIEKIGDNYRIEKDLLKETFSSNYLYLTMILAALGGVFTILTFSGFKDARATKSEFQRELVELRAQLAQARLSAEDFDRRRIRFEEEHAGLLKKYEVQDKRLEVVELLEKAQTHLVANGNSQFALDYATKALELAPERPDVLRLVASCLNRLNRPQEALKHLEQAYALQPEETIGDLLECRAFLNRFDGLEPLIQKHQSTLGRVNRLGGGHVFRAFRHYHNDDLDALLKQVEETINTPDNVKRTGKKMNWSAIEAIQIASHLPNPKLAPLLLSFLGWCEGQVSHEDVNTLVQRLRRDGE